MANISGAKSYVEHGKKKLSKEQTKLIRSGHDEKIRKSLIGVDF